MILAFLKNLIKNWKELYKGLKMHKSLGVVLGNATLDNIKILYFLKLNVTPGNKKTKSVLVHSEV